MTLGRAGACGVQHRLVELREERDEASAANDLARVEHADKELDAVEGELRRAYGLGDRARTENTPAQRAACR